MQAGGQHLGGFYPPLIGVISKAGDAAGLIMVVEVEGVPGFPLEPDLPLVQDLAEGGEAGLLVRSFPVFCLYAGRSVHVLKVEAHAKLGPFIVCIFLCLFDGDACRLSDGEQVVFREDFLIHFL